MSSLIVGKDGAPLVSDRTREEADRELEALESRKKLYRLHPDVVAAIQNIVTLSFLTAEIEGMEVVNVAEEICEMMLEASDMDPTGSMITVNAEWYDSFKERMDKAADVIDSVVSERMAALVSEKQEDEDFPF